LVESLRSESALRKSFELIAAKGPAEENLDALFAALEEDAPRSLDGVKDKANMPLEDEPQRVRDDLNVVLDSASKRLYSE